MFLEVFLEALLPFFLYASDIFECAEWGSAQVASPKFEEQIKAAGADKLKESVEDKQSEVMLPRPSINQA